MAFSQLKREGINDLHYLTKEEIGLQLDDMVDGTHPNDLGMMRYAEAYEKSLRHILNEPVGEASTTQPITQYREPLNYDWEDRHHEILELNKSTTPKTIFIANSIIHFWGGLPKTKIARDQETWTNILTPNGVRNFAYGWDRIENVLWRIYHGELDGFDAERVVMMIGTNNLHLNDDDDIIKGLELVIQAVKTRQSKAKITVLGLLPRMNREERIRKLNLRIARLAGKENIEYGDLGPVFLKDNGKIKAALFSDGLHPNKEGYLKMNEVLLPVINVNNE